LHNLAPLIFSLFYDFKRRTARKGMEKGSGEGGFSCIIKRKGNV